MDTALYTQYAALMDKAELIGTILFACVLLSTVSLVVIALALCVRRLY